MPYGKYKDTFLRDIEQWK